MTVEATVRHKKSISEEPSRPTRSHGFYFDVTPVAKGRARLSRFSNQPYTPEKTRNATDEITGLAIDMLGTDAPLDGPLRATVIYVYASPKRKKTSLLKITKPDGTNLVKLIEDALLPGRSYLSGFQGLYHDDAQIVDEHWLKMYTWGPEVRRGIYIRVSELNKDDEIALIRWAETEIMGICGNYKTEGNRDIE